MYDDDYVILYFDTDVQMLIMFWISTSLNIDP